jgi:RimJ/RimL family protein N-acetyltransferase
MDPLATANDDARMTGKNHVAPGTHLRPFENGWAERVADWVTDDREVFLLAPKTPPPLTGEKVLAWTDERDYPRLLFLDHESEPVAYGELHYMPRSTSHLWLGHLVVASDHRGRGLGVQLTTRLLTEAFTQFQAKRVSLVVFPDNEAALRCYRRAGLIQVGEQKKYFETTRRHHRMIAMTIDRARYRRTYERP